MASWYPHDPLSSLRIDRRKCHQYVINRLLIPNVKTCSVFILHVVVQFASDGKALILSYGTGRHKNTAYYFGCDRLVITSKDIMNLNFVAFRFPINSCAEANEKYKLIIKLGGLFCA